MKKHSEISNCRFAFRCTQKWSDLDEIVSTSRARYCGQCEAAVHLCFTEQELEAHALKGHCVAFVEDISPYDPDYDFEPTVGFLRRPAD